MSTFDYWWSCRGEAVENFNERRGGQSGVEKVSDAALGVLFIKRQVGHLFRSFRYPFGRPTAIRERDAYLAFAKLGLKTPELVFVDAIKNRGVWRAVLVTKNLAGFISLAEWYAAGGPSQLHSGNYPLFLQQLGNMLGQLHRDRWCHGSLHFSHIYVAPGTQGELPQIAFLDLERAQRKFTAKQAAKRDLRTLQRRAPIVRGRPVLSAEDWSVLLSAHQKALEQ